MTPLGRILRARIEAQGPITLADYMAECLFHPDHGYYATRDPLGAAGDFTTAPEVSQMFGEMLGLALAQAWLDQGSPSPFALVELGPGRGTLMADLLRATRGVPGFHAAMRLTLLEASPALRARQAEALAPHAPTWIARAADLPDLPTFLVANEFFDALPIRQFQRDGEGWRERLVGVQGTGLGFGLGGVVDPPDLAPRKVEARAGEIVETCAPGGAVMGEVAARITARGGAGYVVDYGDWQSLGDTFQAVQAHRMVGPFEMPGEADLTAHVDFAALAGAARPARISLIATQGVFLERLGIVARAQALARAGGEAAVATALRRLTHPSEMGSLFKVMGLRPEGAPPLPGLEDEPRP